MLQTTKDKSSFLRAEAELIRDAERKEKADRTKDLGEPIQLTGVALDLHIVGKHAWIAENTTVLRKVDLETGKTVALLRGHTAPATSLALYGGDGKRLISGSWDKTIKVWDADGRKVISSTEAHLDFVKSLLAIPSAHLLVSTSSDKTIRFWDMSAFEEGKPLVPAGSFAAHTRPVEALSAHTLPDGTVVLYTGDTMGIIKVWELHREGGPSPRWRANPKGEDLKYHRTKISELVYGNGQLWSASADETVQVSNDTPIDPKSGAKPMPPITHSTAVRAILPLLATPLAEPYLLTGSGDVIRAYDISSPDEPELLGEMDAHWHDVIALRLWMRKSPVEGQPGKFQVEPWIVSASLDGTLRKWRLMDLLRPPPKPVVEEKKEVPLEPASKKEDAFGMTEDEERELAELMEDD